MNIGYQIEAQDGFDELTWNKQAVHNASLITTNYYYLSSGLLDYQLRNNERTSYVYDSKHRISSINIAGQNKQTFTYDTFDRITNVREEIGSRIYNTQTAYDVFGRVKRETYPSGYYTENTYDKHSHLKEVRDKDNRRSYT